MISATPKCPKCDPETTVLAPWEPAVYPQGVTLVTVGKKIPHSRLYIKPRERGPVTGNRNRPPKGADTESGYWLPESVCWVRCVTPNGEHCGHMLSAHAVCCIP